MEDEKARMPAVRCRQRRAAELNMVVFGLEGRLVLAVVVFVEMDPLVLITTGRLAMRGGSPATHFQAS